MTFFVVASILLLGGMVCMGIWVKNLYTRIDQGQMKVDLLEGNPTHDPTKRKTTI